MPQFNAHLMQVLEDNRLPPEKLTQLKEVRQKLWNISKLRLGLI